MGPGKMGDIEKSLDLAPSGTVDVDCRRHDGLEIGIPPSLEVRQELVFSVQSGPDQPEAFDGRECEDSQLWRDRHFWMRRHRPATSVGSVMQPVIGTDNHVVFDPAHAERCATMGTEVSRDSRDFARSIDNEIDIQETCPDRFVRHLIGSGDWKPRARENVPIRGVKRTFARRRGARFWKCL